MSIIALKAFRDNYIWLIVNEKQHTITCIDPGDAAPVLSYAKTNNLILNNILITHHHVDHAAGLALLLQYYPDIFIYGPADSHLPLINTIVRDEDIIHIDNLAFRVLSTPGHTASHLCYQEPTQGWLFCGDTLFSAGCGRVFDGSITSLHHTILLLKNLPQDTKIYCGHEYTLENLLFAATVEPDNETIQSYIKHLKASTPHCSLPSSIALEREINPFMRTNMPSIQAFARREGLQTNDSLAIFTLLRTLKNAFITPRDNKR